ncbi:hypothetical protein [Jannaschia sp. LMIT008]|uniref:hypothetical protein n=1 Tax=Jannaschia maritima TaxID=3032585 RepID=UPI002811A63F|nr:hypothetical protein [Jannaschia sp. LMIT008]
MTGWATVFACAIVAILVVRAVWVLRREGGARPRGVEPGDGHVEIESEYFSGLGGGAQQVTRVPRDPQAYARAFVPRNRNRR